MFGPSTGSSSLSMPAADFWHSPEVSQLQWYQISPGNAHPPSHLCPLHLLPRVPCKYWALMICAISPHTAASYAVSVRRASDLPSASFRFHLTMDTLAVRLTLPLTGCVEGFHLRVDAPCRAHTKEKPRNLEVSGFDLFVRVRRAGLEPAQP